MSEIRKLYYIGKIVPEKHVELREKGQREWITVYFVSEHHWRNFFRRWRATSPRMVRYSHDSNRFYFDAE